MRLSENYVPSDGKFAAPELHGTERNIPCSRTELDREIFMNFGGELKSCYGWKIRAGFLLWLQILSGIIKK